ncbi:unnamed protein product [Brachionus calyciflorus]|uniref:Calx-beta domain-containing protein n=1 Tax=Brachionus calyciflorus TaxID=104777 RepID=A0A813MBX6_9BILA|nr:unnamed protein product [Brachionus calyciflorus]
MSLDLNGSCQDLSASTLSFQNKRDYESYRTLIETRKPIDFSVKLYHPKPLKRNSREAIKPWEYDKYLKPSDLQNDKEVTKISADKAIVNSYLTENSESNNKENEIDFEKSFRTLTPNGARIEASKNMGFRDGLEQFKNPQPYDFRGLKYLFGMPEFQTRFEKDPFDIKFLSSSLNQIHGYERALNLREVDKGLQMGDKVKKADPHYDPNLILPRLKFPNKFNGYSRYRNKDRSIESAFWDRVLPKLSDRLNDTNFSSMKDVYLKKTSSNTLLSDKFHYELESLNFSFESADKIVKLVNKLETHGSYLTETQKLKVITNYSNVLRNHPYTYYKINAIKYLTGSCTGSFAIRNDLEEIIKENRHFIELENKELEDGHLLKENNIQFNKVHHKSICHIGSLDDHKAIVYFSANVYAFDLTRNFFYISIVRSRNLGVQVSFSFKMSNGSLESSKHFQPLKKSIFKFEPGQTILNIPINFIPNSEIKSDEYFYAHLEVLNESIKIAKIGPIPNCIITTTKNNIYHQEIEFLDIVYDIKSKSDFVFLKLNRLKSTSGSVHLGFKIFCNKIQIDYKKFTALSNEIEDVEFRNGEKEKIFMLKVKSLLEIVHEKFVLKLVVKKSDFKVKLGERNEATVFIKKDKEMEKKFERILSKLKADQINECKKLSLVDQFKQSLTVNNGDLENSNLKDYFLHLVSIPWKVLFSFIPPADIFNGWLSFVTSLIIASLIVYATFRLATLFGCLIGISSTMVSLIIIPIGIGVPAKYDG